MKALILAAGMGSRLRPLTLKRPKPLLEVGKKPLLEHIIDSLSENGIREIFIVVSYKKEMIMEYFGDGSKFGVSISYLSQEDSRGGTGAAVKCAKGKIKERFILLNGDIFFDKVIIKKMIEASKNYDGMIVCREVSNPQSYGILETDKDRIVRIVEKPDNPKSNLANAGMYIFSGSIFDAIDKTALSERGELEITDSIQLLIDSGAKLTFLKIGDLWMDIGTIEDYERANDIFAKLK
jgi:UDP-N-acetylglucosamine diphosphorylase / glucose-1-phosphate thymidylyltransferase / UDP-N-acetylgalactosamine diphosphorylase / glucosamine-1-phosphate N-acetyltransferase / galactosamine-1-phosphate N-acetyltransferase